MLRGKALLVFLQLFKMNSNWFVIAIRMKFYQNLDKLLRDNFKYVQCCLYCVLDSVNQMVPDLLSNLAETFNNYQQGIAKFDDIKCNGLIKVVKEHKPEFKELKGGFLTILGIMDMVNSQAFSKYRVFKGDFVQKIAFMLENYDKMKTPLTE